MSSVLSAKDLNPSISSFFKYTSASFLSSHALLKKSQEKLLCRAAQLGKVFDKPAGWSQEPQVHGQLLHSPQGVHGGHAMETGPVRVQGAPLGAPPAVKLRYLRILATVRSFQDSQWAYIRCFLELEPDPKALFFPAQLGVNSPYNVHSKLRAPGVLMEVVPRQKLHTLVQSQDANREPCVVKAQERGFCGLAQEVPEGVLAIGSQPFQKPASLEEIGRASC